MDGTDLDTLTQAGRKLFMTKLLLTSVQCLWAYDYLLTLEDEIQYAWSGRRSWIFALFIANRYTPVVHLIWVHVTMFHYVQPYTKWVPIFHASATAFLAQTTVAIRIYAVSGKNKLIGGTLALIIVAGLCFGIFSIVWIALGPLQQLPDIDLDEFKVCIYRLWNPGELVYYSWAMFFDVLAFLAILIKLRRPRMTRYPGMPSILDTLLQDATHYFILIFSAHILSVLFLFVTSEEVQLLPAMANTILVPVMASRLMLSLKKAALRPKMAWSLETMTNLSSGRSAKGGGVYLASRLPDRLHESLALGKDDIGLEAMP